MLTLERPASMQAVMGLGACAVREAYRWHVIALAAMLACWLPELPMQKQHWIVNFKQTPKI